MTGPSWPADRGTRWSRGLLRLASRLVRGSSRSDWLAEWEAELWHLRTQHGGRGGLFLFVMGAFRDATSEWWEAWRMDSVAQDTRFAIRTLARSPGFTAAALLTLALSIGASTALFSVVEAGLLSTPPYPEPERLVVVDMLFGTPEDPELSPSQWSYPRYRALSEEMTAVDQLAGYGSRTMTLTELGDPAVVSVEVATPSLFPLLGVRAERGRLFGPREEYDGAEKMVVLVSHAFWETRMGRDPDAVGTMITLDQLNFQVLGVVSPGFRGVGGEAQVWLPMAALHEVVEPSALDDPWNQHFHVMGRLAEGATLERARAEAQAFGATVMERFPPPAGASRVTASADVIGFTDARANPTTSTSMVALFVAVLLVLLIATANLAGLLSARGATRRREAAVRASLGAGRSRLVRQLLTESLLLSCIGGALGIGLATIGVDALGVWLADALGTEGGRGLQFVDPEGLSINWKVMAFALGLTGGVGIAFGLLPSLQVSRANPNDLLKNSGSVTGASGRTLGVGSGGLLIAGQVALAVVLLSAASLMLRTMVNLQQIDLGFDQENLLTAMYSLSPADEQAGIDPATLHVEVLNRMRALPGVTAATLGEVPMGGPTWRTIVFGSEGRPELVPSDHVWIRVQPVADEHLTVLGATLIEGRDIESTDDADTEKVVVLGQSAAAELFPDGSAIGRRFQFAWAGYDDVGVTVVGVVEDIRLDEPGALPERLVFVPMRQAPQLATGVLARTIGDPESQISAVRSVLAELAPSVALTSTMSMESRAWSISGRSRVVTGLLSFFGLAALLLVAVGLYGTIAYTVVRRTRELGLRASLGASRISLATLVIKRGLAVTLAGIALGIVGSVSVTRFLQSLLVGTRAIDPVSLTGVSIVLFAVACVAAYLPARRGMRVDPMRALKTD